MGILQKASRRKETAPKPEVTAKPLENQHLKGPTLIDAGLRELWYARHCTAGPEFVWRHNYS